MYELIIKILGEKDYRKYTIEEIEEMKNILEQFKQTEEVRLRKIYEKTIVRDNQPLWVRSSKEKTSGRNL